MAAPTSSSESVENVLLKLGHKGNDRNAKDVGLTDDVHEEHVDSVFCGEGRFEVSFFLKIEGMLLVSARPLLVLDLRLKADIVYYF